MPDCSYWKIAGMSLLDSEAEMLSGRIKESKINIDLKAMSPPLVTEQAAARVSARLSNMLCRGIKCYHI